MGKRFNDWLIRRLKYRLGLLGQQLIIVWDSEAPEMRYHLYSLRVTLAADRWAGRDTSVALADWQRAMVRSGRLPGRFYPSAGKPPGSAGVPPG